MRNSVGTYRGVLNPIYQPVHGRVRPSNHMVHYSTNWYFCPIQNQFLLSATLFLSVVSCFRFLRLFCDRSPIAKNSPPLRFFTFSLLLFLFLFFCCFEFSNFELWSCQPIFVAFLHSQDLPTIFHSSQISPSPLLHASSWFTPGAPHSLNRAL